MRGHLLVICGALILTACGAKPEMPGGFPPPLVGVAAPLVQELPTVRELTGVIEAAEWVELKPQVSGAVLAILAADGAEVVAGQELLRIDPATFRAALDRAGAALAVATARQTQARLRHERVIRLVGDHVISQQEADDTAAGLQAADAEVLSASAATISAGLDLKHTVVTAPIAGRLGTWTTTTGNLVQGGGPVPATLLCTLASTDRVEVVFDLDEESWNRHATQLRASMAGSAAAAVRIGLAGETGYPHAGRIISAENRIAAQGGTMRLRASVPDPDRRLTPGAFARVELELEAPHPHLLVHERAVQAQAATRFVRVLGTATGGAPSPTIIRPVQLGARVGELRVIDSGLAEGEVIVVTNLAKILFPGMPVVPMPVGMLTLAPAATAAATTSATTAAP